MAATVIGGTSILGGMGGYGGTIIGALILTVLNRLLLRLDVSEAFKQMLYGVIVLALAWLYVRLTGQQHRGGRAMTGVGVIGTGFMGVAHTEALRRLGLDVVGIVGSTPERARAKARGCGRCRPVVDSVDALLADPAVDVVHVTSPNHVHAEHVRAALAAGKHVVCEKPLGVSSAETAELLALAEAAGVVHAVCFNLRYYAQNQHAAALVAAGAIGEPRFVTGRYHQDWLLLDTDWNWRLDAARQGALRAVADIGSHWLDLARFVTGRARRRGARRPAHVRDRARPPRRRRRDVRRRHRRARRASGCASTWRATTRPGCCCASRTARAARARSARSRPGARTRSSGSSRVGRRRWPGRRRIPEHLWIGHRDRPNELVEKDPALMAPAGVAAAAYPAGHVEGYPDTFRALFAEVYRDVAAGAPVDAPDVPDVRRRPRRRLVCEAIADVGRTGAWTKVERP